MECLRGGTRGQHGIGLVGSGVTGSRGQQEVGHGEQNLYLWTSAPDSSASDQLSKSGMIVSFLIELCCCVARHSESMVCVYIDQDTQTDRRTHTHKDK